MPVFRDIALPGDGVQGIPEELERARAMQFSFLLKDDPAAAAEWAAANAGSAEELAQMEAKLLRTAETSKRFAALEGWLERHATVEVLPEDVTQASGIGLPPTTANWCIG